MKTDLELLKLAAKAAGYAGSVPDPHGRGLWVEEIEDEWNPLTDDGDAMRLAVKLRFEIFINHTEIDVRTPSGWPVIVSSDDEVDPYAATRRAIVRAAAEIGETE